MGRLERGRVIHTVTGHGHNLPLALERLHQTQLLLGRDAGTDRDRRDARLQLRVVQPGQLIAGQQLGGAVTGDLRLRRDGARRQRVVPGDHHHPDAGGVAVGHGRLDTGTQRVGQAEQADKGKLKVVLGRRPLLANKPGPGHPQHAQALRGHGVGGTGNPGQRGCIQMAQVGNGLRRALGRHHMGIALGRLPDLRHGAQLGRQAVLAQQGPVLVQMLGLAQRVLPQPVEGLLHRVVGLGHAGQNGVLHQHMEVFWYRGAGLSGQGQMLLRRGALGWGIQRHHRHAVFGQGASLVHAQHRGRTQGFNRRDAPGQHLLLRQPPRSQRRQHRQHHRELLRQHGHGQRDARQQRRQPVAPREAQHQHQGSAGDKGHQRQALHQPGRLPLERRPRLIQPLQQAADAPDLAARAGGGDARRAVAIDQQRAGKQPGRAVGQFVDRQRLAGQQRFVHLHIGPGQQTGIGRDPVALRQHQQVAAHHLGARNALHHPIAHHQRARAGELAQSPQRVLGAPLLVQGQRQHHQHQPEHDHALLPVAQGQVQGAGGQQQHEHRLAQGLAQDHVPGAALFAGQHVGAVLLQPLRRLGRSQARVSRR